MTQSFADFAIIAIPILVAVLIYTLACGARKSGSPSASQKKERTVNLSKLPIVTVTANDILLNNYKMNEDARAALERLTEKACVFVFVIVRDLQHQTEIEEAVTEEFNGVIDSDHILYCQTALGRASMSRQLEAVAHIDFDPETVHQVSIFHKAALIAPSYVESPHAAWKSQSLTEIVANPEFNQVLNQ